MALHPLALPVRRPTATAMFFLGLILLGLFAWYRIPVELMPALSGEQLVVTFGRQGSEPEVVERELLIPLQARIGELAGLQETWAEINGASGRLQLEFERGTNYRVRELELRSIAAELNRTQPEGTFINVGSQDLTAFSRFAMIVQVTGGDDANALRDFVDERIQPRLAAVPGVSQVQATGGAPREVTVWVDPERSAAYGIRPEQLNLLLSQSLQQLRHVGGVEQDGLRSQVVLDGRPGGVASLGELRIDPARPVLLRHVAEIEMGVALAESAFRINGADATGLIVFQEEGANLVRLGRNLRARIEALKAEFSPYGIDFQIGFDAAETVEQQLERLRSLAIWGFAIALIVLYLFLRELRAVAVVAVAVPVSLLTAGAMLYLGGYTLNLITLLGLVVGIGMLVDNSVVVFEAVQRRLERGLGADEAAIGGVRHTVRAIITASATNAIVFLPALYLVEDSFIRGALELIAVAILLPLAASLIVALGLVPLLAQKLAAPAAVSRLQRMARRRHELGGARAPDRPRALLSALLKSALRRPAGWIVGVTVSILLTLVIALPWVLVGSLGQQPQQVDQLTLQLELDGGSSLDAAVAMFERVEQSVLALPGIERVESSIQELGGSLTVHLADAARDSGGATPGRVREEARRALAGLAGVELSTADMAAAGGGGGPAAGGGGGGGAAGGLLGETSSDVLVSGPDMERLHLLAGEIQSRLISIADIESAVVSGRTGQDELRIEPLRAALTAYRLFPQDVLNMLNLFRREGLELSVGYTLPDGRELPLTVRRPETEDSQALRSIEDLRLATEFGAMPLGAVTTGRTMPPAPAIAHHNGRRELAISYSLSEDAPETGPERVRLEEAIKDAVREAYRPPGYTVEAVGAEESTDWFRLLLVPILLLLYAVLAIAFESLTMPILVLIAVPLTVLGAAWALVLAGVGAGVYALVGVIALLGLTVNPAILLVDRMQRRLRDAGGSGGSAAIAAVRERTRPVLMTSCTTIAGLWPLALSTGEEFEIWPPFATVVMGGLATSTLLTLLVIPVGYVMLSHIDRSFGRLGPWILLGWIGATAAVIAPLILTEQLVSLSWQIVTTVLVAAALLWLALSLFRRRPRLEFDARVPAIEARYLSKVYGRPGPVRQAWQAGRELAKTGVMRSRAESRERASVFGLLFAAALYLAINLNPLWNIVFAYVAAAFATRFVIELKDSLWPAPTGLSGPRLARRAAMDRSLLLLGPWLMLATLIFFNTVQPELAGEPARIPPAAYIVLAAGTLLVQAGRRSARRAVTETSDDPGRLRSLARRISLVLFGLDLPREQVEALATTSFSARQGMIGILGPNGAGKSTLLRMLAAVLEPSSGAIHYSGRLKRRVGHYVSRWVGYLPQEFGLPDHLTAAEYLDYFALLYQVGDRRERRRRVDELLAEVGLSERRNDRIGGFSGGMRQRVAVARTLLRQPPIIIVDEPTVGLDPRERIRFRNLLTRLAEGRVVLFSTHVVEDVAVSCRRVVVMSGGRIVYDGNPADLTRVAAGSIWELNRPAGPALPLPAGCKLVDEVPAAEGGVRLRLLSARQPFAEARPVDPTIEDGYLKLVNSG